MLPDSSEEDPTPVLVGGGVAALVGEGRGVGAAVGGAAVGGAAVGGAGVAAAAMTSTLAVAWPQNVRAR